MLDLKVVRADPAGVAAQLRRRGAEFDAEAFCALDEARKGAEMRVQGLQAERKQVAKKIGELVQGGMAPEAAKAKINKESEALSKKVDEAEQGARAARGAIDDLLLGLPNLLMDGVPDGASEADNKELARWGEPPRFDFPPQDHVTLGEALGGLDFAAGAKLTGARFTVLRGQVARLHRGLVQFMLDMHTGQHGYTEVNVPYIVNSDSLRGTGQLPKFEDDLFKLRHQHDFYLVPTAEVPVTNLVRDEIIDAATLGEGLRFVCHSPCFRSEAGSHGQDTRGMIRQHQFEKVELVQVVPPGQSGAALEALTGHAEAVLQALGLPYRKVLLCAGDTGAAACKTHDLEVWLPGQQAYREISSCSDFGDYQARRMRARWRNPASGKPELLHTLNGSALAVGRTLVALLENGQQADGSVTVPAALRPFVGGMECLTPA